MRMSVRATTGSPLGEVMIKPHADDHRPCRRLQGGRQLLAALVFVCASVEVAAGPAIGQFELKDLEAEPGKMEFQSQNAHSWGQPGRKIARGDDEPILDDNSVAHQRHALEMEASVTNFLRMRLGVEYEKERLEEVDDLALANSFADLKLDEVAVEVVAIFSRVPEPGGIGFGALAEFEAPVGGGDDLNSIVFGPIVEARFGPWGAVGNLLLVHHFGNGDTSGPVPERDEKWDLAYATQVSYQVNESWMFTLEGYGTFDRLGNSGTPGDEREAFGDHDQHRAGPIIYYSFSPGSRSSTAGATTAIADGEDSDDSDEDEVEVTLGVGMLFGLNDNTPDQTLKWSLEVEF
ncbi:MAG: hypothetical protein K0U74_07865 [Alphaproteobacteria bacterium]|nr:hypothetical protein [Alphaproteobacteria bacterium]